MVEVPEKEDLVIQCAKCGHWNNMKCLFYEIAYFVAQKDGLVCKKCGCKRFSSKSTKSLRSHHGQ